MEINETQGQFLLMWQALHLLIMFTAIPLSYLTYKVIKHIAVLCEAIGPLLLFVFVALFFAWMGLALNIKLGVESVLAPNIYLNEHYSPSKYEYSM